MARSIGQISSAYSLRLREAEGQGDGRRDDDGLPAPEVEPRQRPAPHRRLEQPLHRVVDAGEADVAAEREDHGVGVQRAQPAERGVGQAQVGGPPGELERDGHTHEHAHDRPEDGGAEEQAHDIVVVGGWAALCRDGKLQLVRTSQTGTRRFHGCSAVAGCLRCGARRQPPLRADVRPVRFRLRPLRRRAHGLARGTADYLRPARRGGGRGGRACCPAHPGSPRCSPRCSSPGSRPGSPAWPPSRGPSFPALARSGPLLREGRGAGARYLFGVAERLPAVRPRLCRLEPARHPGRPAPRGPGDGGLRRRHHAAALDRRPRPPARYAGEPDRPPSTGSGSPGRGALEHRGKVRTDRRRRARCTVGPSRPPLTGSR